jgi:hypothetical protein
MSRAQDTREGVGGPAARAFDAKLVFSAGWTQPLGRLARVMLAYIFVVEGAEKTANHGGVGDEPPLRLAAARGRGL